MRWKSVEGSTVRRIVRLVTLLMVAATGAWPCGKHIVVLYNYWEPVLSQTERVARANQYLDSLLFEEEPVHRLAADDSIDNNGLAQAGLATPLYRAGDCVSYYAYGMTQTTLSETLRPFRQPEAFWRQFAKAQLHSTDRIFGLEMPPKAARSALRKQLPTASETPYQIALSSYALPSLLASLPDAFGTRTLVVRVGYDYASNAPGMDLAEASRHVGPIAKTLEAARAAFQQHVATDYSLLQIAIGGRQGLKLQILELAAPARVELHAAEAQVTLTEVEKGRWRVQLPSITLTADPANATDLLYPASAVAVVRYGEEGSAEASLPPPRGGAGAPSYQDAMETTLSSADLYKAQTVRLVVQWYVYYAPPGFQQMRIPVILETAPLATSLSPIDRPFPWRELIVTAFLLLATAWFAWRRFLAAPAIDILDVEAEQRPDPSGMGEDWKELVEVEGQKYMRVLWCHGAISAEWKLRNTARYPFRRPLRLQVVLGLGKADAGLDSTVYRMEVEWGGSTRTVAPGDNPAPIRLRSGETARITLTLDLASHGGGVAEPRAGEPLRTRLLFSLKDQDGNRRTVEIGFQIEEDPGPLWVAVDPGTSGSCAALGSGPEEVELVELQPGQSGEDRHIMRSLVYICTDAGDHAEHSRTHIVDGIPVRFLCGEFAFPLRNVAERCFISPKRLIGYRQGRVVEYEKREIRVPGRQAVSMLVQFMLEEARRAVSQQAATNRGRQHKVNKIVVAVPNMFTPHKIREMKRACELENIQRVEHIYEAEATLMYYLWKSGTLLPPECLGARLKQRSERNGEFVLGFDFGGASLNLTYARIQTLPENGKTNIHVDVRQRLGYSLGGNRLDWDIGNVLWETVKQASRAKGGPPFQGDPENVTVVHFDNAVQRKDWYEARSMFWELCEKVKIACAQRWGDQAETEWDPLSGTDWADAVHTTWLTPRAVIDSAPLGGATSPDGKTDAYGFFGQLENALQEITAMCQARGVWGGVDTLIFSGRSVQFPTVKERAVAVLKGLLGGDSGRLQDLDLGDERKTCVAQGAAFWASQPNIVLSRDTVFAHYGAKRIDTPNATAEFVSIIPAGRPFDSDGTCGGSVTDKDFTYNGGQVRLYQVMGSDPQEAIVRHNSKNRRDGAGYNVSLLGVLDVRSSMKHRLDHLRLRITGDDMFEATARCHLDEVRESGEVEVADLLEDQDESARWLVVSPSGMGRRRAVKEHIREGS